MEYDKIEQLVVLYPQLFSNCWGAECGNGWYDLLNNLCRQLKEIVEKNKIGINVVQVKEKFGGLRFYIELECDNKNVAENIYSLIAAAEKKSYNTCESCGAEVKETRSTNTGWLKTLCDRCMEERNKEIK